MGLKTEVPVKWGQNQRRWHIDRTISISHIISFVMMLAAVFVAFYRMENQVEINSQNIRYLQESIIEIKARAEQQRREIKGDFLNIQQKLDRIITQK